MRVRARLTEALLEDSGPITAEMVDRAIHSAGIAVKTPQGMKYVDVFPAPGGKRKVLRTRRIGGAVFKDTFVGTAQEAADWINHQAKDWDTALKKDWAARQAAAPARETKPCTHPPDKQCLRCAGR